MEHSETMQFELRTHFPGRCMESYDVEYELYPSGRTLLMSVKYQDFPLDTVDLAAAKKGTFLHMLYSEISDAIKNNAQSNLEEVKKETSAFESTVSNAFSHFSA